MSDNYINKIHNSGNDYYIKDTISNYITKEVRNLNYYYTKDQSYTRDDIDYKISSIPKFGIVIVDQLPLEPPEDEKNFIFLVQLDMPEEEDNWFEEYVYLEDEYSGESYWEKIGTSLNKDKYYTKTEIDATVKEINKNIKDSNDAQDAILNPKIDSKITSGGDEPFSGDIHRKAEFLINKLGDKFYPYTLASKVKINDYSEDNESILDYFMDKNTAQIYFNTIDSIDSKMNFNESQNITGGATPLDNPNILSVSISKVYGLTTYNKDFETQEINIIDHIPKEISFSVQAGEESALIFSQCEIPESIRQLNSYGISYNNKFNCLDYTNDLYIQEVEKKLLKDFEWEYNEETGIFQSKTSLENFLREDSIGIEKYVVCISQEDFDNIEDKAIYIDIENKINIKDLDFYLEEDSETEIDNEEDSETEEERLQREEEERLKKEEKIKTLIINFTQNAFIKNNIDMGIYYTLKEQKEYSLKNFKFNNILNINGQIGNILVKDINDNIMENGECTIDYVQDGILSTMQNLFHIIEILAK